MKKRPILKYLLIGLGLLLLIGIGVSLYRSQKSLTCSRYSISSPDISAPVRILQLTDLHNAVFGENNQPLLDMVAAEQPDLIFCTGDFITGDDPQTETALQLIRQLCEISPVYFSLGNHEEQHAARYGTDVTALFQDAGAEVLDFAYTDVTVNGQNLRIGGIYGYCLSERYLSTREAKPEEVAFLKEFQDTSACTLLLCHMPACWIVNDNLDVWQIDCVFAGHAHGGQIVLPLIGGLYAPDQGLFPGTLEGTFSSQDGSSTLILSRGLGNSIPLPRFNNIPEVVTVELLPAET